MAQVEAAFTFSLPDDMDANQLVIYESNTQDGQYLEHNTHMYEYGTTTVTETIDDTRWYKIRFVNTNNSTQGPISDPVYGGNFSHAAPFLAVSTATDGAHYATVSEVYEFSGLSPQDVPQSRVSSCLKRSRAHIDYRTAEMDFDRFDVFDEPVARRKYNATLRILKEAELHITLGNVYQSMSDDEIIQSKRTSPQNKDYNSVSAGSVSVGGEDLADRSDSIAFLAALSDNYFARGEQLLASLDAPTIRLRPIGDRTQYPRFTLPFNGIDSYRPVR